MNAPHTLQRDEKQIASRAQGTVIYLTCPTCAGIEAAHGKIGYAGKRVARLIYVSKNRVDLVDDYWHPRTAESLTTLTNVEPDIAIEAAQRIHQGDMRILPRQPAPAPTSWTDNPGAWTPGDPPVVDGHVTGRYENEPAPVALPWETIAGEVAAALHAQALGLLLPQIKSAGEGYTQLDADLLALRVLDDLGVQLRGLAATRARNMIYAGVKGTDVARALGVSKQAINKKFGGK